MNADGPIPFQPLADEMVSSACRLSTQAGWEQTAEDWRRFARMDSAKAWVLLDEAGEVRASYSLASYGGGVVWIGMILVDKVLRGRGLGSAAFAAAQREAARFQPKVLGLDATDLGEPIYAKAGFETAAPIQRWAGVLRRRDTGGLPVDTGFSARMAEFDHLACGVDRGELLRDFSQTGALILRLEEGGLCSGYAVLRPSRTAVQLGPVAAQSRTEFEMLIEAAAEWTQGRPVICDVLQSADAWTERGLQPVRTLKRMTAPAQESCLTGPRIWAAAGFEWG
jgi:GNAT superfamily N-acetyltransferase